jgi:hypothetical protein
MRVDIYWNLNEDCYSIRSREPETRGRVVGHADEVVVEDAEFVVQPAGHAEVLRTGQKNVHAFIRGRLTDIRPPAPNDATPVTYKPDVADYFFIPDTDGPEPVRSAETVWGQPGPHVVASL